MSRPKLPKRKVSVSVTIEETSKKTFRKMGEGNMSKGIEVVLQAYLACQKELKELKDKMGEKA